MLLKNQRESSLDEIKHHLNKTISGDVLTDPISRSLYSTDASIYQIQPLIIVFPKSEEDLIAIIETAYKYKLPVLPRGAGTSLAGQTTCEGIIIDFSKYMHKLIEINAEEKWVSVQPGIVLDELNQLIYNSGLMFAPDPSTSNRSNVGGALGNNSCGAHSLVWGKTVDNVQDISGVLSNGDQIHFTNTSKSSLVEKTNKNTLESSIYKTLKKIPENYEKDILENFPDIQRRVSGYNLDELIHKSQVDFARFVIGSEGTLFSISEAKLKLVERPKHKALTLIFFKQLSEAMEATKVVLETMPSAIEVIDDMILNNARTNLQYSRLVNSFIDGNPKAMLIVEVMGDSQAEIKSKLEILEKSCNKNKLGYSQKILTSLKDQKNVWDVRKAGLGLMMNVPGDMKPLPFVEDTAVAPEVLPQYVDEFTKILKQYNTTAGYYGHAGEGCLHIRPVLNLKEKSDIQRMESIAEEISDLVIKYGGSLSGEHGDGLVRGIYLEKLFGKNICSAFREVKNAFDPKGIMNPGKIVNSPKITDNLKQEIIRSPYFQPQLHYSKEKSFEQALEMCNGQAACRKLTGGMCPSYIATRNEEDSTRGRANALKAFISSNKNFDDYTAQRTFEVLDLCLECKSCKSECPSNVDMTKLKYEFLQAYYKENKIPLRNYLLGKLPTLNKVGSIFAPLSNWIIQSSLLKFFMDKFLGITKNRSLPPFSNQTFTQWFKFNEQFINDPKNQKSVIIFPDTFTNFNYPHLGKATVRIMQKLNYNVIVPPVKCCGRPMLSSGFINSAKQNAKYNIDILYPLVQQGIKIVGIEPSCLLSFRDDYISLLGKRPEVEAIAKSTFLIEEFLEYSSKYDKTKLNFKTTDLDILFHGHCHQKAIVGTETAMNTLESIPGCNSSNLETGCCGMAGSFGYHKEHYELSMQIGQKSLFSTLKDQRKDSIIVTEGVSCRQQIQHAMNVNAKHLVEIIADSLD